MQMQRLKYLSGDVIGRKKELNDLVLQNAATLVSVTNISRLPVAPGAEYSSLKQLGCDFFLGTGFSCPQLERLDVSSFSAPKDWSPPLIPSLTYVYITDCRFEEPLVEFIARNAASLKFVFVPEIRVEKDGKRIVYQKVEELKLFRTTDEMPVDGESFPRLRRLIIGGLIPPASLTRLPVNSLVSMNVYVKLKTDDTVNDFVTSITRLANLRELGLHVACKCSLSQVLINEMLDTMFQSITGLEVFSFSPESHHEPNVEHLIQRVVDQNPNLRSLKLSDIANEIKETTVTRISTLTRLRSLEINFWQKNNRTNLMPLFTGATRNSLIKLTFESRVMRVNEVEQQFRQMLTERGLEADANNWKKEASSFCFSAKVVTGL